MGTYVGKLVHTYGKCMLKFYRNYLTVFKGVVSFYIFTNTVLYHILTKLVITSHFNFSYPNECVVESHYGLNLYFSIDQ